MRASLVAIILIAPLFFLPPTVQAAPPITGQWTTGPLTTTNVDGLFSSLALDPSDRVRIAYYDNAEGDLRYVADVGDAWQFTTVDSVGDVGSTPSLALDSAGKAHISYSDVTNHDLKYATNAGGLWSTITIDGAGDVGFYSSLALDSADKAHISYYDTTGGNLKYATNAGGSWSTTAVDSIGDVGAYSSLALDSYGRSHISYYDQSNLDLKYATNAGGPWDITTVDSASDVGLFTSLAIDSNNKAHISYCYNSLYDLKYATNAGGSWSVLTVDDTSFVGSYTSLALDSDDRPHISYYDGASYDLKYALYTGSWYTTTIDSDGAVGWSCSLAIDSADMAYISYYDVTNHDLRYAAEVSVPSAPRDLHATAGDELVDLSWTAPAYVGPGTITYHLFRDGAEVWSGTSLSHRDQPLTNDVTYSYTVAAVNSVGWSPNSSTATAMPTGGIVPVLPSIPRNLQATAGDEYVRLSWNEPSTPGTGTLTYHLYRNGAEIWTGGALMYNDTAVVNDVTYIYTVAAENDAGWGPNSTSVTATPHVTQTAPSVPIGLQAEAGDERVTLTWSAPSQTGSAAITGYKVYRGTASGSPSLLATVVSTNYNDINVVNGQTYHYQVSAVSAAGESALTADVMATPSASASTSGLVLDTTTLLLMVALIAAAAAVVVLLFMLRRRRPS